MRQFMTTAVEQRKDFTAPFTTHPMECAWASEAIFFIHVEKVSGTAPRLEAKVQISVDGVHWVDEGTAFESIDEVGHQFVKVRHFGNWLRLVANVSGSEALFNLTIHLVLKE